MKIKLPLAQKKEHGHWVVYNKRLGISGYGATKKKAKRMAAAQIIETLKNTK